MARRDFADILAASGFDVRREYRNLYDFVHNKTIVSEIGNSCQSFWNLMDRVFSPDFFKDTSVSLEDFESRYGFIFPEFPSSVDLDQFLLLCEYVYNLLEKGCHCRELYDEGYRSAFRSQQELIRRVVDRAGCCGAVKNGFVVFVERDPLADEAATVLPDPISWQQMVYGHRSLKGNLEEKKKILQALGDYLEPRRKDLNDANKRLCNLAFACLNNLNIRHNNIEPGSSNFNAMFAALSNDEREDVYDEVYHILLLGVLELEYARDNERLKELAGMN